MRTRQIKKRKTKRKNRKTRGGVLLYQGLHNNDIMPILKEFENGEIDYLSSGRNGLILKLTSPNNTSSSRMENGINSILIKVVTLDGDLEYNNVTIDRVHIDNFEKEVHFHQKISHDSLERFGCSIVPTILFAEVYTPEQLTRQFPNIARQFKTIGQIGIIFMEHVKNTRGELAYPLDSYFKENGTDFFSIMLPIARRLLIMLAQLGFLHNDFHLGNILFTGNALLIIDFGRATIMSEELLNTFNRELEFYERNKNPLKIIEILYGRQVPILDVPEEDIKYYLSRQWLGQNQIYYYVPEIDPKVLIAPQSSVVQSLLLNESQLQKTISFPLIPYVERDKEERKRETPDKTSERIRLQRARDTREAIRDREEYNKGRNNYSESEREETRRLERSFAKPFNDSRAGIIQEKAEKVKEERERIERERIERERVEIERAREAALREAAAREAAAQQKLKTETPQEKEARLAAEAVQAARDAEFAREYGFY